MPSKIAVKVKSYLVTIYKVVAILSSCFLKISVCFKLNYFKLIYLQANLLSSFIFTFLQTSILICFINCHSGLENTRFKT